MSAGTVKKASKQTAVKRKTARRAPAKETPAARTKSLMAVFEEPPDANPTPSTLDAIAHLLGVSATEPEAMFDAFVALLSERPPMLDPDQLAARELTPAEVVRCRVLGWEPSFFLRAKRVLEEAKRT